MNNKIIEYLEQLGYTNINQGYYSHIETWENYWENNLDFHRYYDSFDTERKMYSLGMAKKISEDWASNIWSERDKIKTSVETNQDYIDSLITDFNLDIEIPNAIETSAWSGTCGSVVRVKNAIVVNGILTATEKTTKELILLKAKQIIPLRREHGKIVDVAFVSETMIGNKDVFYIEVHTKEEGNYHIKNKYIDCETGEEVINDDVLEEYQTGSDIPLFNLLTPPKNNPIKNNMGLGFSVYGNALDQIKATDIMYHNFVMDFYLGGKKVFYNKKIVKHKTITRKNSDGTTTKEEVPIYPDDVTKQQWATYGDEMETINDNPLYKEYNPDLRVSDNKEGIQYALDLLSFKAGLGAKYYNFNNGSVSVTATQYTGDKQDLVENSKKYRDRLTNFVSGIIKAGLLLGRLVFHENVTEDCDVLIENVDGFLVDDETAKREDMQAMQMGLMSKISYLVKHRNMTEDQAKKELALIEQENSISSVDLEE